MTQKPNILIRFWQELKRRKVFKVVAMYVGTAYIIIEVIDTLSDPLHLPPWVGTMVVVLLVTGLPIVAILAWIFDLTPQGIKKTGSIVESRAEEIVTLPERRRLKASDVIITVLAIVVVILAWPKIFRQDAVERLRSSGEKLSVAVMPFQNMTNDTNWDPWQVGIQQRLISSLSNSLELQVRHKESIKSLLQNQGLVEFSSISPVIAGTISEKLDADIFIYGSIQQAGNEIGIDAQLIDTKTKGVIKSFEVNGPSKDEVMFPLTDTLRKKVVEFLIVSKLIKDNPGYQHNFTPPKSSEALRFFLYGVKANGKGDYGEALNWYHKSLAADSNFTGAALAIENSYAGEGNSDQSLKWLVKNYEKRDQMSYSDRLFASWAYAFTFESPEKQIEFLKSLQETDDQSTNSIFLLGLTYNLIGQYEKAIPEYEKCQEIYRKWGKEYLKDPSIYWGLGEAYHLTGQFKKEKKLYRKAAHYIPDNPDILIRQAILAFAEKDSIAGNRYINRFISVKKSNSASEADIASGLALLYSQAGILDKAEGFYRKAFLLEPEDPGRINQFAEFLIKNNRSLGEVSGLMDKAMGLARNKVDYYRYLNMKGWGLYKQGKNQEALEILQKAWDEAPFKEYSLRSNLEEVKKAVAGQN